MIPLTAHFVWIGESFPWLNYVALASAAALGGFERITLHHTDDLSPASNFRALGQVGKVRCRRLDPARELDEAFGPRVVDLYRRLLEPAARSNLIRLSLLTNRGGVYLDLDTVTLQRFAEPCEPGGFFCGSERIAFPASLSGSLNPLAWLGAYGLSALREVVRRTPHAVSAFRRLEPMYPARANNAVLGAEPRHPFLFELCERALSLSSQAALRRYALGTSLLQDALAATQRRDVQVHSPESFYPLPPEISEHWFRADTRATLRDALTPETRVVHWYASVRTRSIVPRFDRDFARRSPMLLAELLRRKLPQLFVERELQTEAVAQA